MDIREIRQLVEIIKYSTIAEIEIREGKESIRINRSMNSAELIGATTPINHTVAEPVINLAIEPDIAEHTLSIHTIKSPLVGTFYRASSTSDSPFVDVGQSVSVGDTLCIIQAMKILNQIEADGNGIIKQILIDNDQPVEFGQPLFVIE